MKASLSTTSTPRLVVDGTDEHGSFAGDGRNPPFVIFDVEQQCNVAGPFNHRKHAEQACKFMIAGHYAQLDDAQVQAFNKGRLSRAQRWLAKRHFAGEHSLFCDDQANEHFGLPTRGLGYRIWRMRVYCSGFLRG